ncbi:hypothetical protein M430DRAFT_99489, partial [Amorphotheca resinae ATCC 22711]
YSYFKYYVMPFRLVNVLATFYVILLPFINKVLENLVNNIYIVYLNNILIYFINKEEYI